MKINKWMKEQKGKDKEIKIGFGRVKIGNSWKAWADIEKEEADKEKGEGREVEGQEGIGQRKNKILLKP